jgi:IclR family acetate operon transcriptional repressor
VSNIKRVMRILDILVAEPAGVRITDLATALGVNKAIPHRLLAELVDLGYAVQDPRTDRYRATFKLGSLGLRQLETAGIARWSQDELNALAAESKELVRLAVASGHSLRWVAKAQGANSSLIVDSAVASDVVLHATASGKAWLSTLPADEVRAILAEHELVKPTPRTHTDPDVILAEIDEARRHGYAVTFEEMEVGINAIAVPIVPPDLPVGRGVGTVSIAGPAARLTPEVLTSFAPSLKAAARSLGEHWRVYEYLRALTSPVPEGSGRRPGNRDTTDATELPAAPGVQAR